MNVLAVEWFLPVWGQIVLGAAAVLVAASVIWNKVLKPGARLVVAMDRMLPLLQELTVQFADTPHAFKILREIIAQFRTDSGTTLRDVINRIEQAANDNRTAAMVLKTNAEAARELAEQDRRQIARLVQLLDTVNARVELGGESTARLEAGARVVGQELDAAQIRANAVEGEPGEAADAAVRKPRL